MVGLNVSDTLIVNKSLAKLTVSESLAVLGNEWSWNMEDEVFTGPTYQDDGDDIYFSDISLELYIGASIQAAVDAGKKPPEAGDEAPAEEAPAES